MSNPIRINSGAIQCVADATGATEYAIRYGGRDSAADALFPSGECAIIHGSSGLRGRVCRAGGRRGSGRCC
jgi:hypothetical protein